VIPSPNPDPHNEDACRAAAARLQHDHKNWLVLWGCYTHSYVAFPLFSAPRGTILTARTPGEMAGKMRREERMAGLRVPAHPGSADPYPPRPPDPYAPPQDRPEYGSLPPWPTAGRPGDTRPPFSNSGLPPG
jgi:hypothetical protein